MTAVKNAWVSWDHHEGRDLRTIHKNLFSVSEVMHKAFKAGWEQAGGDQRLEAVEQIQVLMGDCPCHDREYSKSDLCVTCAALNDVLKILAEDEAVSE